MKNRFHDYGFPKMVDVLSPGEQGKFALRKFTVTEEDAKKHRLHHLLSYSFRWDAEIEPGDYIKLIEKGKTVIMSDTYMERATNMAYLHRANGRVLQAGLGIGMTLIPILKKPEVKEVVVIEKEKDVIDLVMPQLVNSLSLKGDHVFLKKSHVFAGAYYCKNTYLTVINKDIFEWWPPKEMLFDTIYFDIWNDISSGNWEQMKKLRRKFARRLNRANPKAWMDCWRSYCMNPRNERW